MSIPRINRRRAPSAAISRAKKLGGHKRERVFAKLIRGQRIPGVGKSDVVDRAGNIHSVKGGNKWQVFLYGFDRICRSKSLRALRRCLEAFPSDSSTYFQDRVTCIAYKERLVRLYDKARARGITNAAISRKLGSNSYIASKRRLARATQIASRSLRSTARRRAFLKEAIFNNNEVQYLAAEFPSGKRNGVFHIFSKGDVLRVFSKAFSPSTSKAGHEPRDLNIAGQKLLLTYNKPSNGGVRANNIVEIEIRNDSEGHYRQARFNMYSKDAVALLLGDRQVRRSSRRFGRRIHAHGAAVRTFRI